MQNDHTIRSLMDAYKKMKEKALSPAQDKHLDVVDDDEINAKDFEKLRKTKKESSCGKMRKEEKMECPKCKGKGCSHCDDTGYHMKEEVEQIDEAKTSIRVDIPYYDDEPARAKKVANKHRVKVVDKGRDYQITGDKKSIVKFLMDKDTLEWDKDEIQNEFPELFESVDEAKYGDTGWRKVKGPRKDKYGNTVKNVAQHLAKKGMETAKTTKKEGVDLFNEEEFEKLVELGVFESREKHYKGATAPEGLLDKSSPKSKEFAAKHNYGGDTSHPHANFDDKGHDDVTKAGRAVKTQSPARTGDKLSNGDSKNPKGMK